MQTLTNLPAVTYLKIAEEVKAPLASLVPVITLLERGVTVPFLARYRKHITGGMNEDQLWLLVERLQYFRQFEERRQEMLRSIEQQGRLTPDLRARMEASLDEAELDDLYFPYRPQRKSRAAAAREKGLDTLADWLWRQQPDGREPESAAENFVNPERGVAGLQQAIEGARDILAERIAESAEFRRELRQLLWQEGVIVARKAETPPAPAEQPKESKSKFEMYYDFQEAVATIPSQRLLAIRRGVKEGELSSHIQIDDAKAIEQILGKLIQDRASVFAPHLEAAARDGYHRILNPSVHNEVRAALKQRADEQAILAFQENLRNLLLAAPAPAMAVLGVDPGHRAESALVVIDEAGKFQAAAAAHLSESGDGAGGNGARARALLRELITRHNVRAVAVGNAPGCREADSFVRAFLRDEKAGEPGLGGVFSIVVSEAGATVYASRLGKEEFPELDPGARRAVTIARRLQDPLAELVRIDPNGIAVGQYHHEVDPKKLHERLRATVMSCVNRVGADLNAASLELLESIAGLNERLAKRVLEFRQTSGGFTSRAQLKEVPGFPEWAFEQAAGFLRVCGGTNPLDRSAVHPESYPAVEAMAASLGVCAGDLVDRPELLDQLKLEELQVERVRPAALKDIVDELRRAGADPRGSFVPPIYREDVLLISDLKEGMELEGRVTNVTSFGAFVDVGVHQDGLVHISEISGKFVKDPREAVQVGDLVKVRVLAADVAGRRISFSMKPPPPPKVEKPAPARDVAKRPSAARRDGDAAPAPKADQKLKQARPPQPKTPVLTMDQKLALLQSKFRTRVS